MKAFFARVAGWFDDRKRSALQALIVSALTLLTVTGITTEGQSAAIVDAVASVLIGVQGVLGLALLRDSEWAVWFGTHIRGSIYAIAAALGPIGFAFNLWGDETSTRIVSVATVLVSILTAFVQVLNTQTLYIDDPVEPLDLDEETVAKILDAHALRAAAARPVEADPATFAKEREPEWVAPLSSPEDRK